MAMALIKCEDCGQEVSEKSKRCIHCGSPNSHKLQITNASIFRLLLKAIFVTLIICFIYLLYANWQHIEDCHVGQEQYNTLSAAALVFLSLILQIFGSDLEMCKGLGSPSLVLLSRIVFFGMVGGGVVIRIAKKMGFSY
jgi:magnesium-transporting ATPase (P-type)